MFTRFSCRPPRCVLLDVTKKGSQWERVVTSTPGPPGHTLETKLPIPKLLQKMNIKGSVRLLGHVGCVPVHFPFV